MTQLKQLLKLTYAVMCVQFRSNITIFLPELKLRRIFLAVDFTNNNLPDERVQVLLPEEELSQLPMDSQNIFKESNVDCYMDQIQHSAMKNTMF